MQDLNDLYYFAAVVDHHGFAAAARALAVPKSTLSRRVAQLEARLGVRLLERSTRRFSVTPAGQTFYQHCRAMAAEAQAAEDAMAEAQAEPRGLVRISAPVMVAQGQLAGLLPRFLHQYPKVRVQMLVTNRRVDLIEEGVDIALRIRTRLDTDQDLTLRQLGRERVLLVASPAFIAEHGAPGEPQHLAALPTLSMNDDAPRDTWRLQAQDGREEAVTLEPRLAASDFKTLLYAALAGQGIAFLPDVICAEPLREGRLVRVLPEWSELQGMFHMVFTTRRGQRRAVTALIDFLAEHLPRTEALPWPTPPECPPQDKHGS
ncbi:MAG: LysR family transcriptional regulator [Proteobacteria bacterium]|nr:LysR family transcriptional regulator [Pseudomonadota bacterium]